MIRAHRAAWLPFLGLAVAAMVVAAAPSGASVERMRETVEWLSAPERGGRGAGSEGLRASAEHLLDRWSDLGPVEVEEFSTPGGVTLRNLLLAVPPESGPPEWIVVGAHYDHLGVGEEGGPHAGTVHPGADDNASGVAVLEEVARLVLERGTPPRGVLFVLFSGEENGLLGSRAFLARDADRAERIAAMVNLDTVGRPGDDGFGILGVDSAPTFRSTLEGLNSAFGLELELIARSSGGSDEVAFLEKGIPALHVFGGAHADYHRPSDTAEKLDYEAMDRLAAFVAELVDYLGQEETHLDFVPAGAARVRPDPERATEGRRRVSFGSIPDFQHQGEGVRISGVLPGSPAAEAGLREGDVIVSFGGDAVGDLTGYSEAMKRYAPGDVVTVGFLRDGERREVEVTLVERR